MSNKPNCKSSTSEIERQISADQHVTVRIFLSWQAPLFSLILGLVFLTVSQVNTLPLLVGNVMGIAGVLLISYGLIGLGNYDWSWGQEKAKR
ncbi:hypothetical protein ACPV5O_21175 [Vibrio maritimus]|uniref:hypothetical protein n=1 Tax=Vibrio maritimus TaxID=990268 RepID=UPI004068AD50